MALAAGMRDLKKALGDRNAQLRSVLDELERNHRALQEINREEWTALKNVLTVEQQAKYILFHQEFNRELKKMIENAKEKNLERMEK
jgi:hypothetical protein